MDWKQIETKWAAMARRIRADVNCGLNDDGRILQRRTGNDNAAEGVVVTKVAVVSAQNVPKRSPVSTH